MAERKKVKGADRVGDFIADHQNVFFLQNQAILNDRIGRLERFYVENQF